MTGLAVMDDKERGGERAPVRLSEYDRTRFDRGAGRLKELCWLIARWLVFEPRWLPLSRLRCSLLRWFGGTVGKGVVIKSGVRVTFPWRLHVGDDVWIGEDAYLHDLDAITIGANACISQRAFLCTGNHDYSSPTFDLWTAPISVGPGAWVGACAWVGPGVGIGPMAVLTAGSVASRDLEAGWIYRGNPAQPVRERRMRDPVVGRP